MAGPPAPLLLPQEPVDEKRRGAGALVIVALIGVVFGAAALAGAIYLFKPEVFRALLSGEETVPGPAQRSGPATAKPAGVVPRQDSAKTVTEPLDPAQPSDGGSRRTTGDSRAAAKKSARLETGPRAPQKRRQKRRRGGRRERVRVVDPGPDPRDVVEGELDSGDPPKPPPSKQKKRPRRKGSELDELIDAAARSKPRDKTTPRPSPRKGAEGGRRDAALRSLNRAQVTAGMQRANAAVQACYQRFGEAGQVTVKTTIAGATGRVSKATVVDEFAGTPTGVCVAAAVRAHATFPTFSGASLTLRYPFMLR
jgi:hypothetical protein